jgi:hypothetical protein
MFLNYFRQKIGGFHPKYIFLGRKMIITFDFWRKMAIFSPKIGDNGENSHPNIDPC